RGSGSISRSGWSRCWGGRSNSNRGRGGAPRSGFGSRPARRPPGRRLRPPTSCRRRKDRPGTGKPKSARRSPVLRGCPKLPERDHQVGKLVVRVQSAGVGQQPHVRTAPPLSRRTGKRGGASQAGPVGRQAEEGDEPRPEPSDPSLQL